MLLKVLRQQGHKNLKLDAKQTSLREVEKKQKHSPFPLNEDDLTCIVCARKLSKCGGEI